MFSHSDVEKLCVPPACTLREAVTLMERSRLGILLVVDAEQHLIGTITDGDVRRAMLATIDLDGPVSAVLERKAGIPLAKPITALVGEESATYLAILQDYKILHLPVLNRDGRVVGLVTRDEFFDFIGLFEPALTGNEWKYVKECLDSGWVSSAGAFVGRFERELAAYVGSPHAVATMNGTAALHLALKAVGVREGDEVIVPDLTFIAPVNAVRYCQAHPVVVDADPQTWQIDVQKLKQFLREECELRADGCYNRSTRRPVRAVLPVHVMGLACPMDEIASLAGEFRLVVVEDACEALGVRYHGRHVGTFGDAGVFSFNGNKIVTSGGGGMIVTGNRQVAERAHYLSTQAKDDDIEYIHNDIGYNYRLTNVQAALGVAQLEQIDAFIARKRFIAQSYENLLGSINGVTLMPQPNGCEPIWWLYTVLLPEGTTLAERKRVIEQLHSMGIGARPFWRPIHSLPPYRDCQAFRIEHSSRLYERGVSLPSSVGLTDSQIERTVAAFRKCIS